MDWKTRVKNYGFWVSLISQVVLLLGATGVLDMSQLEEFEDIAMIILGIMSVLGIVNNPTDGKGFRDSPK